MPGLKDIVKNALSGATGGFFSGAADVISKFIADPTEKAKALKELEIRKIESDEKMASIELDIIKTASEERKNENDNVTKRWESDMASDSWLSKNTRPLVMMFLIAVLFILIILDSSIKEGFDVKPDYIDLLKVILEIVIVAYFGGRTLEKGASIVKR